MRGLAPNGALVLNGCLVRSGGLVLDRCLPPYSGLVLIGGLVRSGGLLPNGALELNGLRRLVCARHSAVSTYKVALGEPPLHPLPSNFSYICSGLIVAPTTHHTEAQPVLTSCSLPSTIAPYRPRRRG